MTRAQYQQTYGSPPPAPSTAPAPVKMTRAEYQQKYGTPPGQSSITPQRGVLGTIGNFGKELFKGITRPLVDLGVASPIQAAKGLYNTATGKAGESLDVELPFYGKFEDPTKKSTKDYLLGQAGKVIQTGALAYNPSTWTGVAGIGGATGLGMGLENYKNPSQLAADTALGAGLGVATLGGFKLGGKALQKGGQLAQRLAPLGTKGQGFVENASDILMGSDATGIAKRAVGATGKKASKVGEALPRVLQLVGKTGERVDDLPTFSTALTNTRNKVWGEVMKRIQSGKDAYLDNSKIFSKLNSLKQDEGIQKMLFENPKLAREITAFANKYKRARLDVPTAERFLEQSNAFLRAIYERHPSVQQVANLPLRQQLEMRLATALREGIDDTLENVVAKLPYAETRGASTGLPVRELKKVWADLRTVGEAVDSRIPIDQRLRKFGLNDIVNTPSGLGDIAGGVMTQDIGMVGRGLSRLGAGKILGKANDRGEQIKRAIELTRKPAPLNLVGKGIKALGEGAEALGTGIQGVPTKLAKAQKGNISEIPQNLGLPKNPKLGLSMEDVSQQGFKDFDDLSTKLLGKLEGRKTVSRQFIEDLTNSPDLKQPERDLFRKLLQEEGPSVDVTKFANKVKTELLPLEIDRPPSFPSKGRDGLYSQRDTRYENITLPDELRGPVANYEERIYRSPIKTSAGDVHFSSARNKVDDYFAHSRIEDLPDNKTRRVIEAQSDLFQKGRLDGEYKSPSNYKGYSYDNAPTEESLSKDLDAMKKRGATKRELDRFAAHERDAIAKFQSRKDEVAKLKPYENTWHERIIKEEVKQAAKDGKTKLQFPTGETAMKIEGLGDTTLWAYADDTNRRVMPDEMKVGMSIVENRPNGIGDNWIITDVLGDGKFKAVPKRTHEMYNNGFELLEGQRDFYERAKESFDISGKVDTENPIYKFYEKEVGKYLKNKYGATLVTDPQGVKWWEVNVGPERAKMPIEAFGLAPVALSTPTGEKPQKEANKPQPLFPPKKTIPSLAKRNNNPGNQVFVGQKGAEKGDKREDGTYWAKFPTEEAGLASASKDIDIKLMRKPDMTIRELVELRSPAHENNIKDILYIISDEFSEKGKPITVNGKSKVRNVDRRKLVQALAKAEGYNATTEEADWESFYGKEKELIKKR